MATKINHQATEIVAFLLCVRGIQFPILKLLPITKDNKTGSFVVDNDCFHDLNKRVRNDIRVKIHLNGCWLGRVKEMMWVEHGLQVIET